jgi:hypothetical protein
LPSSAGEEFRIAYAKNSPARFRTPDKNTQGQSGGGIHTRTLTACLSVTRLKFMDDTFCPNNTAQNHPY